MANFSTFHFGCAVLNFTIKSLRSFLLEWLLFLFSSAVSGSTLVPTSLKFLEASSVELSELSFGDWFDIITFATRADCCFSSVLMVSRSTDADGLAILA